MRRETVLLGMGLSLCAGLATAAEPDFNWLVGHWCSEEDGRRIDEVWLPQAGGMLLGMSRTVNGGKIESFEFMRIATGAAQTALHVQPNGAPPTVFAMTEHGEGWIRFGNAAHDFPNRIEYRREGEKLPAWIAGPGRDGKELKIPFDYRRCDG